MSWSAQIAATELDHFDKAIDGAKSSPVELGKRAATQFAAAKDALKVLAESGAVTGPCSATISGHGVEPKDQGTESVTINLSQVKPPAV